MNQFKTLQIVLLFIIIYCEKMIAGEIFPVPRTEFNPRHYVCYRTTGPLNIDGKIEETDWQNAQWTDYFVDIEGDLKPKPTFNTRAKMLWDDEYFYMAAFLEEPHVWAKLKQRDTVIYYDDDFEIFIDPNSDAHEYYEYEMNAFNTVWDLFITQPYRDDYCSAIFNWDIEGLKSGVYVDGTINDPSDTDKGWYVEVAIPWPVLKEAARREVPPNDRDQWRVGFSRVDWQMEVINHTYQKKINPKTGRAFPENNWIWSQQGLIAMHYPERWGIVQFSKNQVNGEKADFIEKEEYLAANYLYEIYYFQKQYYLDHGLYTKNIRKALKAKVLLKDFNWPPTIEVTPKGFELILQGKKDQKNLLLNEEGRLVKF
ncbi:MAG: carbohydrate-binding family 9-like protein [Candidatus Marinimicrobia bacterium]|nr:carbohydrate-binding family 9-like protein [Candidatus Neomarinimicrobiota bacterium]